MPIGLAQPFQADADALSQASASLPVPDQLGYEAITEGARLTGAALNFFRARPENVAAAFNGETNGLTQHPLMSSEEANARYGVEGYKRFNEPVDEVDAAFQQSQAYQRQFQDEVLSRSTPNPLRAIGGGLLGTLTDPASLALMVGSEGILAAAKGGAEVGSVSLTLSRLNRVGNLGREFVGTVGEGAFVNAPFVGADAGLRLWSGDDYTSGDALRDLAAGAIFHTGFHYAGVGVRAGLDLAAGRRARFMPEAVQDIGDNARGGAFVKGLDDAIDDRAVDVGQYVERERNIGDLSRLDETTAEPAVRSWRPLAAEADATAVTPRGGELSVRYGLIEASDLVTSHTDELDANADFPAELQPRDRSRAGAQARNYQLEAELNPKLLMRDVAAASGAPIISPEGVVESGNGRAIALRRSAAKGGEAFERYKAELEAQGFDVSGMEHPVLVRMRTEALPGAQRASLAREMNADVTERMSASEQAQVDGRRIPAAAFGAAADGPGGIVGRDFARAFIDAAAPDQVNTLANADGSLSPEGGRRIKAAVLSRAYDDPYLTAQILEGEETSVRQIAEGLAAAAPAWAKLRAATVLGEAPAELDLTPALRAANDLVRYAREEGVPLGQLVSERLGQGEMFGGETLSPQTEAFLRLFFKDEALSKPQKPERIAAGLREYARQAMDVKPGPDLFGDTAGDDTARQILANLETRYQRGDAGDLDVRPPGRKADPEGGDRAVVLDLHRAGGQGDGAGKGLSAEGGGGAEGAGGAVEPALPTADKVIAADPELKALAEDTERLAIEAGEAIETPPAREPKNLAEAIGTLGQCLVDAVEEIF